MAVRKKQRSGRVKSKGSRLRLSVFRSQKNIYAQIIDDSKGTTLCAASSIKMKKGNNVTSATEVGNELAKKAKELKIIDVVFDRGKYKYWGRVKALAEAVRQAGFNF